MVMAGAHPAPQMFTKARLRRGLRRFAAPDGRSCLAARPVLRLKTARFAAPFRLCLQVAVRQMVAPPVRGSRPRGEKSLHRRARRVPALAACGAALARVTGAAGSPGASG